MKLPTMENKNHINLICIIRSLPKSLIKFPHKETKNSKHPFYLKYKLI